MLLRQSRLRFHPAVVDLSSGEKNRSWRTNAAARHVGSVALVVYPPELSAHTESFQSSERSAASGEASPICTEWRFFTRTGRRPSVAKKSGDRFCFAGVYPVGFGEDRHRRGHCAKGAFWQRRDCVFPPQIYPRRLAKSDVRQPIKGSRRFCGVAIVTYEDTNRSGRKICTMRYLGSVAMDNSPRELTCRAEKEPIMANQLGRAPRRQCRLGYFSGGVDRTHGKKTN